MSDWMPTPGASAELEHAKRALRTLAASTGMPHLGGAGTRALEAWFLGPKGENADEFERLLVEAVRDQVFWRRNYHPGDPSHITDSIKRSPEYLQAIDALNEGYRSLLAFLKKSVPFFSMRYQGHMNWETTLPGLLGYFAAMLYNPNNVAFEGSTATTLLEILVGDDLCQMLGYHIPGSADAGTAPRPWGHITCDGTVANIEAIWAARNLKFYPLAVRAAMKNGTLPSSGSVGKRLHRSDDWACLNLPPEFILDIPRVFEVEHGVTSDALDKATASYLVQNLGMHDLLAQHAPAIRHSPVFLVPGTKHYSFPKAAAILGIGASNMLDVHVDLDARMDIAHLVEVLERCRQEQRPVITVVTVIGSTEESAIDPIASVLDLRQSLRPKTIDFTVHADGAWGGYHASVIRDDFGMPDPSSLIRGAEFTEDKPLAVPLKNYVQRQFARLGEADSITVDPHKSGYIPYPAGALCYRDGRMRNLVTFKAPVVFHGEAEPTVGVYGIEGSKPGAAAAAVYLSHRVIRPSKSGYGKIIAQALFSCRKLYARLMCMAKPDDAFIVLPLSRMPAEARGASQSARDKELQLMRERIDGRSNADILADEQAMSLLAEIGPDENILAYAFNFRDVNGALNTDLARTNSLNKALYRMLSIDPGQDIYGYDLIVSTTDISADTYGDAFVSDYKRRLGVGNSPGSVVTVLRSVVMDPWVTETERGSFIDVLENEFRRALRRAVDEARGTVTRGL